MLVSFLKKFPLEAVVWLSGLIILAFADVSGHHFTICPFAIIGIDWCPGCGLGRSVHACFRGDLAASFGHHPFGVFAIIILSFRIIILTKKHIQQHGKSY